MSSIKTWLLVVRLPSVLLAVTSVGLGTMLAIWQGTWNLWVGLLAILTAAMLQIIANLANDYGDFLHGAGVGDRVGEVGDNQLVTFKQLQYAIMLMVCLTLGCGLLLLNVARIDCVTFLQFAAIGGIALLAAITYTMGPRPYGYIGLGDMAVFVFFGFIGVLGTAYLHAQVWHSAYLLPASSCGCLAVAVLNINNIRDIALDTTVGKKTLVVRLGRKAALYYQWLLLSVSIILLVAFTLIHYQQPWQWIFLGFTPKLFKNGQMTMRLAAAQLDDVLQDLVITQLFLLLVFGLGLVIK